MVYRVRYKVARGDPESALELDLLEDLLAGRNLGAQQLELICSTESIPGRDVTM